MQMINQVYFHTQICNILSYTAIIAWWFYQNAGNDLGAIYAADPDEVTMLALSWVPTYLIYACLYCAIFFLWGPYTYTCMCVLCIIHLYITYWINTFGIKKDAVTQRFVTVSTCQRWKGNFFSTTFCSR